MGLQKDRIMTPTVVLGGGLGDVIQRCWLTNAYQLTVEATSPVNVVCASANGYVHELFTRHPNWKNLRIYQMPKREGVDNKEWKEWLFQATGIDPESIKAVKTLNPNPKESVYQNDDFQFYTPQWFGDRDVTRGL